jgi:hypothetical protein
MSDHSPAPWRVEYDVFVVDAEGDPVVPMVPRSRGNPGRLRANSRLIAAAPDLLAAARDVLECYEEDHIRPGPLSRLRDAVAQALPPA